MFRKVSSFNFKFSVRKMDKKKRIEVNSSSLVGLKAELIRKQEEFKREKLDKSSKGTRERHVPKKTSIWNKKNAGLNSRMQKDAEELEKERNEIDKSRSMLEAKAKLYEQMTAGNSIPDEQTNSLFLVDFEKKQLDKLTNSKKGSKSGQAGNDEEEDVLAPDSEIAPPSNPEEEWVDYTDTLGRSRRCMRKDLPDLMKMDKKLHPEKFREESLKTDDETTPELMSSDMQRERMRKKWEKEEQELLDRGQTSIHYQNVRFDEVRTHGVAYFDFAKDEETREQQMNTLKFLREETIDTRAKREELKAKRKAAMEARLEKVRQRKRLKAGLVEEEPGLKEDGSNQNEMGEAEKVINTEEEKPKVEEVIDPNWQRTLRLVEAARKESAKADREWDVGKEPKAWADHRAKIRDERPSEFAPPTDYTPNSAKKRGKMFHQSQRSGDSLQGKSEVYSSGKGKEQLHSSTWEENTNKQRNDDFNKEMTVESISSTSERSEDVRMNSWSGDRVKVDQQSHNLKDEALNRPHQEQVPLSRVKDTSLGIEPDKSEWKEGSESVKVDGQSFASVSEARSTNQDAVAEEAESAYKPAPLIRTEDSKPIKFSIGIGKNKIDKVLPSSSNALETNDAEEIKRTLSLFRNQAS